MARNPFRFIYSKLFDPLDEDHKRAIPKIPDFAVKFHRDYSFHKYSKSNFHYKRAPYHFGWNYKPKIPRIFLPLLGTEDLKKAQVTNYIIIVA